MYRKTISVDVILLAILESFIKIKNGNLNNLFILSNDFYYFTGIHFIFIATVHFSGPLIFCTERDSISQLIDIIIKPQV